MIFTEKKWPTQAALIVSALAVYGSMATMSIGAGFVFLIWLYSAFKKNFFHYLINTFFKSPMFWPTVFLSMACAASLLRAQYVGLEFMGMRPHIDLNKDLSKLWHLWFPMVLAHLMSFSGAREQKVALRLWLLGAALAATLGIVQHYVPIVKPMAIPDPGLQHRFHATGLAGFHLSYTSIMVFPTAVALSATLTFLRRKHWLWFLVSFFLFLLLVTAGVFSYSKIYWAALPVSMISVVLMRLRGKLRWLVSSLILISTVFLFFHPAVKHRFGGIGTINDRLMLWEANLAMVKTYPLLGVGWHHNSELSRAYYKKEGIRALYSQIDIRAFESHAHNNALDQWSSTGILGLLAFLWWNAVAILAAIRLGRSGGSALARTIGVGLVAGWIGFHINGLTQTNFWDSKVMHQMAWVVALSLSVKRKRPEVLTAPHPTNLASARSTLHKSFLFMNAKKNEINHSL